MMEEENDLGDFSFLEPYGHLSQESKIERYWNSFNAPFTLLRQRVNQYSVYSGMTHCPLKYTTRRFKISTKSPTDDWVIENLKSFIRTEFSDHTKPLFPFDWPPDIAEEIFVGEAFLENFLKASEWVNRIQINQPDENSPTEIANSIFDLLCHQLIGSASNAKNNDRQEFIKKIVPTIKKKSRLMFVFPGFPFKDQNRFRVNFEGDVPDLAEISFLIRLFNLTQTLYQVHPYGVDIVILTDGFLYQDIFGLTNDVVKQYASRLEAYRNKLNLQGAISFISLREMIDRAGDDEVAWNISNEIQQILVSILGKNDHELIKLFDTLISAMKWNLESRKSLRGVSDKEAWEILCLEKNEITLVTEAKWNKTHMRAKRAALRYASINLMLRWTNLISQFFPDAIRCTIHPKKGQFALAASGAYAWNGVAWSKEWPKTIDDIRVIPFMSLCEYSPVKQVKFVYSGLPSFFTASAPNKNLLLAKNVLSDEGWVLDDVSGRPFLQSDLIEFIELGLNDENYTWERQLQTHNHFNSLFEFRLNHYKRHGFGVHGIWKGNKLIGQFGLQMLNIELDQVEFVVFLGKKHTHAGLGTKLLKYLIDRSLEAGLKEVFAVVRSDNPIGLKLISKFSATPIKTIKHFNQEGIVHQINLKRK
ncbi:MAG: L-tyrosine/L-tryptophan isonitrile synthase family protein [Mucilaginibacter sp.]